MHKQSRPKDKHYI